MIARFCIRAFTLVEMLISAGIISLLLAIMVPVLGSAREAARATKVHAELKGIGLALKMYSMDHRAKYPPVRVNCNTAQLDDWCQLPVELANGRYLPKGEPNGGLAAAVEDEFNPGHSYKYAAPGPAILNGSSRYNHEVWVPDDFPKCEASTGQYVSDASSSPVRWAVWSLGPKPESAKSQSPYSPLSGATWYTHTGDTGVLVLFETHRDVLTKSP